MKLSSPCWEGIFLPSFRASEEDSNYILFLSCENFLREDNLTYFWKLLFEMLYPMFDTDCGSVFSFCTKMINLLWHILFFMNLEPLQLKTQ